MSRDGCFEGPEGLDDCRHLQLIDMEAKLGREPMAVNLEAVAMRPPTHGVGDCHDLYREVDCAEGMTDV